MIIPRSFYDRNTLTVAQDLLGCFLVRRLNGRIMRTKIVEVEAYDGPKDLASHASRGRTARNQVMFGQPGLIYVYLTYGMHYMLNIVTGAKDYPAAVLIRAVEPINRHKMICKPPGGLQTNGPAKLTKVLRIDKSLNSLPITTKKHGLWMEPRLEKISSQQIVRAKRVGVDYAGEYKDKLWRFYLKGNGSVSKK